MDLSSPEVTEQLKSALATASPEVATLIPSLKAEYANADQSYQVALTAYQQANEGLNTARLRRQKAAQALAAYGVTVDQ